MSRILTHLIAVALCVFIVSPASLIAIDRSEPFVFERGVMLTENPRPGDTVTVEWTGMFKRECEGTVHRSIVDSGRALHLLDPIHSVLSNVDSEPNKTYSWRRQFNLPLGLSSGPAFYKTAPEYWCNPLQKAWPIKVKVPDIAFNVAHAPKLAQ